MRTLRFATAGSVDDGKSSLIGRLLYDTKSIYEDQYAAIERASAHRGSGQVELALLTDGLRAEREQNITIDVAYRYFSTPARKFIIADTPGHVQYTRNMVTGTSTAHLSVVLVDASKGVLPQSKRHAAVSILLGVPHLVVAVNKMDLVDYSEERFNEIVAEFSAVLKKLGSEDVTFIPVSALLGDNVVEGSDHMPWYTGATLLGHLEQVEVPDHRLSKPFRLAVQNVIRPNAEFRGFAGRIASGNVSIGDQVVVLPSNERTTVKSILTPAGNADEADAGTPVTLELNHEIDAGRGSLIVAAGEVPAPAREIRAVVCWLGERPVNPGERFILRHTTRRLAVTVEAITGVIDVDTLEEKPGHGLAKNELGRAVLRSSEPIFADLYADNRDTGSFILIDPNDLVTVGAGMIEALASGDARLSHEVRWIAEPDFEVRRQQGEKVAQELRERGPVLILEETELALTLNRDEPTDAEAHRRIREVAALFLPHGSVVVQTTQPQIPEAP